MFSHNDICLILIMFKNDDEPVLVLCRNLKVYITAYVEHMQSTTSVYYFVTREQGIVNVNCVIAFF